MDMRFGAWTARVLYKTGSLMTVVKEISKYKLDLVGIQESRGGTETVGEYTFLCGKENENRELGTDFFTHKRILSAVKRVEFVSHRLPYKILRDRWCHVIVLNVHGRTEDKIDDVKDSF
jgi:hypothetical protein